MDNYQSPLKRAFEGGFNGDAADSTEFCVVNCIANRSAKSFSKRKSEKNLTSRRNICGFLASDNDLYIIQLIYKSCY